MKARCKTILILTIAIFCWSAVIIAQWTEPVRITYRDLSDNRAAASGNTIYVTAENQGVYFLKSTDGGICWTEQVFPVPIIYWPYNADITCKTNVVHLIFTASSDTGYYHEIVYHFSSSDGGVTWSAPHVIFRQNMGIVITSRIIAKGDTLFALSTQPTERLMFSRSFNRGTTWQDLRILEGNRAEDYIAMIYHLGRLHVFYEFENNSHRPVIGYLYSIDKGLHWSDRYLLSDSGAYPNGDNPRRVIACAGPSTQLVVFWTNGGSSYSDIFARASLDNGHTWNNVRQITFNQVCTAPFCIYSGGKFIVVTDDWNPGLSLSCKIFYSESDDMGNTWSEPIQISGEQGRYDNSPVLVETANGSDTILNCIMSRGSMYYFNNSGGINSINNGQENSADYISLKGYPNPFNSSAVISYYMPGSGITDIAIYNLLGQQLISSHLNNSGSGVQQFSWNPHGLSSGTYIVVVQSRFRTQKLKLTLMR